MRKDVRAALLLFSTVGVAVAAGYVGMALVGDGSHSGSAVASLNASVRPVSIQAVRHASQPSEPAGLISRGEAFRFLAQATFGPTESDIDRLIALGDSTNAYERWIDEQIAIEPTRELPVVVEAHIGGAGLGTLNVTRQNTWFLHALTAPDQLRQRVAFALSEILVVSQRGGGLVKMPMGVASYYDMLSRNSFGNFRSLIEEVTLHPVMGAYLNMIGNRKPDEVNNIRPDENYARELMQLFTIGLVQLNPDGTVRNDASGVPLPTYDQSVVEGFAHVFTGWHYAGWSQFALAKLTDSNQTRPMTVFPEQHADGPKKLLSYIGAARSELPAGQTPEMDLADALDNVCNHPNVGPFVSKQLIQRLVSSNPSPEFVARVAAVFADDGNGQRGNLGAVTKAILLDAEARDLPAGDSFGKVKEPLLRVIQLWRAYDGRSTGGRFIPQADNIFGQGPLLSPSVFNFFSPSYAPQGEVKDRGLVAPEAQIATDYLSTTIANFFYRQIFTYNSSKNVLADTVVIDFSEEVVLAGDPQALVSRIAEKLLGGDISPALRQEVVVAASQIPVTRPIPRVTEALYLVATSPEFASQR